MQPRLIQLVGLSRAIGQFSVVGTRGREAKNNHLDLFDKTIAPHTNKNVRLPRFLVF